MKKPNYYVKTLISFNFKADIVLILAFWFGFGWWQHTHGQGILDISFVATVSLVVCYFEELHLIKQEPKL